MNLEIETFENVTLNGLQYDINNWLREYSNNVKDIKITTANNGYLYIGMIIFERDINYDDNDLPF